MAINLSALQKKLDQLSGQNSLKSLTWRPPENEETTIRIIAFPNNDGQPFKERWFYYGVGNNPGLLAPYQFGKPHPFQELITKLRSDESKESYELAKKLYPKMRSYAAVVVRGEEDKGVRLWNFGKTVYQDLLKVMLDSDYGDITDPVNGYDIKVSSTKSPGRDFAETSVRPRNKPTPLSTDKGQAKEWIENIPDLDQLHALKSYDELTKIINTWLEDPNSSDGASRGKPPAKVAAAPTPVVAVDDDDDTPAPAAKSKSSSLRSLDEAFADLDNM